MKACGASLQPKKCGKIQNQFKSSWWSSPFPVYGNGGTNLRLKINRTNQLFHFYCSSKPAQQVLCNASLTDKRTTYFPWLFYVYIHMNGCIHFTNLLLIHYMKSIYMNQPGCVEKGLLIYFFSINCLPSAIFATSF